MYVSGDDGHYIETSQLQALVELSSNCEQTFYYECTLAPLRNQDVDYAYWIGLDGKKKYLLHWIEPISALLRLLLHRRRL